MSRFLLLILFLQNRESEREGERESVREGEKKVSLKYDDIKDDSDYL